MAEKQEIRDSAGRLLWEMHTHDEEGEMGLDRAATRNTPATMNPYRVAAASDPGDYPGELFGESARLAPAPRRTDVNGPGLTAGDLDRIARQHYTDGYAAAERALEPKIAQAERGRARAWDEGRLVGQGDRVFGLATDVRVRMVALGGKLHDAENGPKSKREEQLAAIRAEFDAVYEFVCGVMESEEEHERRAAAEAPEGTYRVAAKD